MTIIFTGRLRVQDQIARLKNVASTSGQGWNCRGWGGWTPTSQPLSWTESSSIRSTVPFIDSNWFY